MTEPTLRCGPPSCECEARAVASSAAAWVESRQFDPVLRLCLRPRVRVLASRAQKQKGTVIIGTGLVSALASFCAALALLLDVIFGPRGEVNNRMNAASQQRQIAFLYSMDSR